MKKVKYHFAFVSILITILSLLIFALNDINENKYILFIILFNGFISFIYFVFNFKTLLLSKYILSLIVVNFIINFLTLIIFTIPHINRILWIFLESAE